MTQHPALPYLRSSEKGKVVSAAEAELHFAFEHPKDLLICVTMRLRRPACYDGRPCSRAAQV